MGFFFSVVAVAISLNSKPFWHFGRPEFLNLIPLFEVNSFGPSFCCLFFFVLILVAQKLFLWHHPLLRLHQLFSGQTIIVILHCLNYVLSNAHLWSQRQFHKNYPALSIILFNFFFFFFNLLNTFFFFLHIKPVFLFVWLNLKAKKKKNGKKGKNKATRTITKRIFNIYCSHYAVSETIQKCMCTHTQTNKQTFTESHTTTKLQCNFRYSIFFLFCHLNLLLFFFFLPFDFLPIHRPVSIITFLLTSKTTTTTTTKNEATSYVFS